MTVQVVSEQLFKCVRNTQPHWLTAPDEGELATAEQSEREASDPWQEKIEGWLATHAQGGYFRIADLLDSLQDRERQTPSTTVRVSKLLKQLGWVSKKIWLDKATGKTERRWVRSS